jgi:hypothetical protein
MRAILELALRCIHAQAATLVSTCDECVGTSRPTDSHGQHLFARLDHAGLYQLSQRHIRGPLHVVPHRPAAMQMGNEP